MKVYDGSSWIAATSAGATSLLRFRYVATSGQTTFTGADAASATLSYTVNNIAVHRNGVTLDTSEYTASNGTSIVLAVAAGTGDIIDIIAFKSFTVSDALSAITGGTVSGPVAITGVTTVQAGSASLPAITTAGDTNTGVFFPAADTIAFAEGGVEAMRIDSAGNLLVGTTTAKTALTVNGGGVTGLNSSAFAWQHYQQASSSYTATSIQSVISGASAYLTFSTNGNWTNGNASEAARLDSSGNLLVGTTSSFSARLAVKDSTSNGTTNAIYCKNSADTTLFYISSNGYFVTGTGANSPYNLTTASGSNVTIESDGVLKRSTSSLKYKTDVQDATHGLAEVLQLRPVTYKGKNDGDKVFGGLIAEEVHEAGLTEFVQYAEDGSPDALAYGNMVSLLTKAIQEQQALIETLTQRITALEGA
jgi:hypothetical protein